MKNDALICYEDLVKYLQDKIKDAEQSLDDSAFSTLEDPHDLQIRREAVCETLEDILNDVESFLIPMKISFWVSGGDIGTSILKHTCFKCGYLAPVYGDDQKEYFTRYCPGCGARMLHVEQNVRHE